MVINSIQFSSALSIYLNSPSKVSTNQEFSVSINADTQETYDVKVFVHNSEDEKVDRKNYISKIYDDGWKDSYLYLKAAYPLKKDYKILVESHTGNFQICARFRKTGSSAFSTQCAPIEIAGQAKQKEEISDEKMQDEKTNSEKEMFFGEVKNRLEQTKYSPSETSYNKQEKIILNSEKSADTIKTKTIKTADGKRSDYFIYGIILILVVIIVLLALKKL